MNTSELQAGVAPAVSLAVATSLASLPAAAQHTLEFFTAQIPAKVARRTRCWMRQQHGLAVQFPLSTAGANKAANVGRRPTLHILPRCKAPFELRRTAYKLHPGCIKTGAE